MRVLAKRIRVDNESDNYSDKIGESSKISVKKNEGIRNLMNR